MSIVKSTTVSLIAAVSSGLFSLIGLTGASAQDASADAELAKKLSNPIASLVRRQIIWDIRAVSLLEALAHS